MNFFLWLTIALVLLNLFLWEFWERHFEKEIFSSNNVIAELLQRDSFFGATLYSVHICDVERLPELPSWLRNQVQSQDAINSRPTRGEVTMLQAALLKKERLDAVHINSTFPILTLSPWASFQILIFSNNISSDSAMEYQIISVQELPWQTLPVVPRERLQHDCEQQRAQYRPLVHAHFHLRLLTFFSLHCHCCHHSDVHRLSHFYKPFLHTVVKDSNAKTFDQFKSTLKPWENLDLSYFAWTVILTNIRIEADLIPLSLLCIGLENKRGRPETFKAYWSPGLNNRESK